MSETKDPRRTRRRASRTAGPPVEDATEKLATGTSEPAAQEAATEKLATGASAAEPDTREVATEKLATGSAQPGTAKLPASTESVTAKLSSSPAASGAEKSAADSAAATTAKLSRSSAGSETAKLPAGEAESVTEKLSSTPTGTTGAGVTASSAAEVDEEAAGASAPTVRLGKAEAQPAGSHGVASAEAAVVALDKKGPAEEETGNSAANAGDETGSGSWKRILALTAAAILVIGLVGAAVVSMIAVQSTEQRDERRAEYVATARQTILNLTTIRADTAKEDIDRILTMASGEFKTEFDGRIDPFTEIVKQAKVQSTGEVVEAAVERDDEKSAVILVAAKQTLTNAGAEGEQQRFYRFRVTVQRADDGTLTASDVEFVA
ncbi:hypothetical protein [Nocardia carnea]|uniref:hypothetical protein n=1 Tax=Nocardia carnea TaxID=37328 RepID=UPI0024582EA1|nr:hypothetical protein [Nocardia carnea]